MRSVISVISSSADTGALIRFSCPRRSKYAMKPRKSLYECGTLGGIVVLYAGLQRYNGFSITGDRSKGTGETQRQMAEKRRLDLLLVERSLAPSRAKAQSLIMAGQVFVADQKRTKAGEQVAVDAPIEVRGGLPYVGRGGLKLAHALDSFGIEVRDLAALDVGACTGGFTDVLLQRGARRVY